jgi:hypothetical protein
MKIYVLFCALVSPHYELLCVVTIEESFGETRPTPAHEAIETLAYYLKLKIIMRIFKEKKR